VSVLVPRVICRKTVGLSLKACSDAQLRAPFLHKVVVGVCGSGVYILKLACTFVVVMGRGRFVCQMK